ncbi:hypothetical protein D3C86_1768110 [compost metagenome]
MIEPERMPGMICGRMIRRNTVRRDAPRDNPAHSTCRSRRCRVAHTAITMNGTSTWVRAMITPTWVNSIFTGCSVIPNACKASLIRPLLPSRIAQPSVRTTTEISSGPSTTSRNIERQRGAMRAMMMVSGTPSSTQRTVTASAMPPVRRKISWK